MRLSVWILAALLLAATAARADDGVTLELAHQGYLLGDADAPVTGAHKVHVSLWRDRTSTNPSDLVWEDDFNGVDFENGRYSIILGDHSRAQKALPSSIFDVPLYMSVTFDTGPEMLPRLPFSTMPRAARALSAAMADTAGDLACTTPGCVDTSDLAPGSVTADVLAKASVGTDKLVDGSVDATKLADGSVLTNHLAAGAVTTDRIGAGQVTTDRLAAGAVTTDRIGAGQVTTDRLAAGAVTTDRIGAGQVTLDRLALTNGKFVGLDADSIDGKSSENFIWNGTTPQTASINLVGSVTAQTGTFSGAVQTGSLQTGALTASSVNATSLSLSGHLAAGDLALSGGAQVGGPIAIGQGAAASNAALDVQGTTKGFLPPRLTQAQRDAIASPEAGLMVFNTTTREMNFFDGTSWRSMVSGFSVRRAHAQLGSDITLSNSTPTYTFNLAPQNLPANTKAVVIGLYFLYGGSAYTHGYLSFWAFQRGKTANTADAAYFDMTHYDWYYNSDYYELIVPWDKSMNDDSLVVQVTSSYNTNPNNIYRVIYGGYITAN